MTTPTQSYLGVHYELRPAKQVERRMLVYALQLMAQGGFGISDYQYTGFGSIYFVDFLLFHRLLGIQKMVSAEFDESARRRVEFNCPFSEQIIKIKFGPISNYIPELDPDRKHILWLDYDYQLNRDVTADIALAAAQLPRGSILLITVDDEPPKVMVEPPKCSANPVDWMLYFHEEAGQYFNPEWTEVDFARSNLHKINSTIMHNAISQGLSGRSVEYLPIFSFLYADGHKMLTIGGVIGAADEIGMINGCDFRRANFIRRSIKDDPYEIMVPHITKKEKIYLDAAMPPAEGWTPPDFEMEVKYINAYREIYRFYPSYAEMMLW